MKIFLKYFLNGLLVSFPLFFTVVVIKFVVSYFDSLFPAPVPGAGLVFAVALIALVGFLGRQVIFQPIVKIFLGFIEKTPVVSVLYKSTKDFTEAFIGNERKFEKPILFDTSGTGNYRVGFLTNEHFNIEGLTEHVGIYIPHSYNFSGNFYIVPRTRIRPFPVSPTDAMRFAVTGGVTHI